MIRLNSNIYAISGSVCEIRPFIGSKSPIFALLSFSALDRRSGKTLRILKLKFLWQFTVKIS